LWTGPARSTGPSRRGPHDRFQELTRGGDAAGRGGTGEIGRDLTLAMWSADGRVIAQTGLAPDAVDQSIDASPLLNDLLAQPVGTFRDGGSLGAEEAIVSIRRLERWPVVVTASMPVAAVLDTWWSSLAWSVAGPAIGCAGLAWLTFAGLRLARADEASQVELRQLNADLNKALGDKVVLLPETHHRVKNNLDITSSLLSLQARWLSDPEARQAFKDTQDRLRSVALIHDALYCSDASGSVRLDDYLRRLVGEVAIAYGAAERAIAISVSADPVEVPIDQAVPLALAVTEALTNAFQHAFPDGASGQSSVQARSVGASLEVTVRDNGQGFVANRDEAPGPASLGARLIETFAAQIGASTSYAHEEGTLFRMVVPRAVPAA
jgi:two-component sensor histidine kinase